MLGASKSGASKLGASKLGASESGTSKSGVSKSGVSKSGASKSGASKLGAFTLGAFTLGALPLVAACVTPLRQEPPPRYTSAMGGSRMPPPSAPAPAFDTCGPEGPARQIRQLLIDLAPAVELGNLNELVYQQSFSDAYRRRTTLQALRRLLDRHRSAHDACQFGEDLRHDGPLYAIPLSCKRGDPSEVHLQIAPDGLVDDLTFAAAGSGPTTPCGPDPDGPDPDGPDPDGPDPDDG